MHYAEARKESTWSWRFHGLVSLLLLMIAEPVSQSSSSKWCFFNQMVGLQKRDDEKWMKHTLRWVTFSICSSYTIGFDWLFIIFADIGKTKMFDWSIGMFTWTLNTLDDEIETFPPKACVYRFPSLMVSSASNLFFFGNRNIRKGEKSIASLNCNLGVKWS